MVIAKAAEPTKVKKENRECNEHLKKKKETLIVLQSMINSYHKRFEQRLVWSTPKEIRSGSNLEAGAFESWDTVK